MKVKLKKAAMFGLDARIALAIFGALSVISGAALYSAIQHSKVIALITQMQEFNKATEEFILTTSSNLTAINAVKKRASDLINNDKSFTNWNGPYISAKESGTFNDDIIVGSQEITSYVRSLKDAWGGTDGVDAVLPGVACTSEPCVYWATLANIPRSTSQAVDIYIDGSVDYKNGKVRIYANAGGSNIDTIYLAGPNILK